MAATPTASSKTKILLELRPALEGFAGIPQETRLLFRGLRMVEGLDVAGMLQTYERSLARGTRDDGRARPEEATEARRINRYSRVIVSMAERPYRTLFDKIADYSERKIQAGMMTVASLLGIKKVKLTNFESRYFGDFVWRTLFSKTLPAADVELVTSANMKVCSAGWNVMHRAGLNSLNVLTSPRYPTLDTSGIDVLIAQTPYPARVARETALVVRYHDAFPVFMPHTIPDKSIHQATHFYALSENVKAGAYFACISDATRKDLLKMFPEAAGRAVTIHNMVSHHYYHEDSPVERVPEIIRARLYTEVNLQPKFLTLREQENFYRKSLLSKPLRYLLVVSTIEPRKNHLRLIAAWEVLKAEVDPDIKLVVVGTLGWDNDAVTAGLRSWIDRGEAFCLHAVPAPDLRVLYRHAAATVCPSLGEGFDYSGVEAMASGGVTVSSDIAVHREIYDEASEYFDPYSTRSLVQALKEVLYSEQSQQVQARLRKCGADIAARYKPEIILPEWSRFLERVIAERAQ